MNWTEINGIVKQGHQIASGLAEDSPYPRGSLEMQAPFFEQRGLDLSRFHLATLNIDISPVSFQMQSPQYVFREVEWTSLIPPEHFSFSRCQIAFREVWHEGVIYYPHPETKPQHFQDPHTIEVITVYIAGIGYGDPVRLRVNPEEVLVEKNRTNPPV